MPDGVIVGGWEYVIAAYTVTAVGLSIYAWTLLARLRRAEREESSGER